MAAVPQLLKVITFTLGATDFSDDVIDIALVPAPGDVQSVTTLDGTTHQDAAAETWGLQIRAVVDWDTVRPGLAYYLFNNKGDTVAFEFRKDTATIGTGNPSMTGSVVLVPMQYGGNGNEFAEGEVFLPATGAIVPDTSA